MRRFIVGLVALITPLGLAASAHADVTPLTGTGWTRWAGPDRYATAVAVSRATFAPGESLTAYVGSGEDFPDALAAGPVAGANGAPLLLTKRNSVPAVVAAELRRLKPATVIVVGGSGVITDATVAALKTASGAGTVRFSGADRYATAVRMANALEGPRTIYIASGESYADALAAGPAAGKEGGALLLTRKIALPEPTRAYLKSSQPTKVVIVGGTGAVSSAVQQSIKAQVPSAAIIRHAGRDRYETANEVALATWPSGADTVFYAPGTDFPDALAATPSAMGNDAPMLLTARSCNAYETTKATEALGPVRQVAVGGTSVTYAGENTCGPSPAYPFPGDLDCKDFPTQVAAQGWYDYWYPRAGDIYRLDRDNDGAVCESWPPK